MIAYAAVLAAPVAPLSSLMAFCATKTVSQTVLAAS
jgi:hypothetical protein